MDDAAKEIVRACTHVVWHDTSFSAGGNALADAACWQCIATALREMEAERDEALMRAFHVQANAERLVSDVMRVEKLLAHDTDLLKIANARVARVEGALRAVMERVYHCPLCKSSVLLSHADKCPIGAALTPDAPEKNG